MNLGIHAALTHTTRYQLGVLAAEIEYQQLVGMNVGMHV
jgi:hypothetical protein